MGPLTFESFVKKIYINSSLDKLYWCWATAEGISSWFLKDAVYQKKDGLQREADSFIEKGDRYTWRWYNWDGEETGEILKANGRDLIEFTFANHCRVIIRLQQEREDVLLSLEQTNIPTDEESKMNYHVGCSNGWSFWLANLKAYLEHGILLNETKNDLRKVPLASFQFVNI
jgi:uncharacterized protein YndB with AHSA1/START domain